MGDPPNGSKSPSNRRENMGKSWSTIEFGGTHGYLVFKPKWKMMISFIGIEMDQFGGDMLGWWKSEEWVAGIKPSGFKNIRDLSYGVYLPAYFILGLCKYRWMYRTKDIVLIIFPSPSNLLNLSILPLHSPRATAGSSAGASCFLGTETPEPMAAPMAWHYQRNKRTPKARTAPKRTWRVLIWKLLFGENQLPKIAHILIYFDWSYVFLDFEDGKHVTFFGDMFRFSAISCHLDRSIHSRVFCGCHSFAPELGRGQAVSQLGETLATSVTRGENMR